MKIQSRDGFFESATTLEPTAPTSEFVVVALPIVNKTSRRGPQFPVVQRVFWLNAKHSVLGVCA